MNKNFYSLSVVMLIAFVAFGLISGCSESSTNNATPKASITFVVSGYINVNFTADTVTYMKLDTNNLCSITGKMFYNNMEYVIQFTFKDDGSKKVFTIGTDNITPTFYVNSSTLPDFYNIKPNGKFDITENTAEKISGNFNFAADNKDGKSVFVKDGLFTALKK
ncbi:MAG: hypothetical protein QG635_2045 [Bacteroidota bacterium]|nr:hypothetical protein [Bacteroidota bacterium]